MRAFPSICALALLLPVSLALFGCAASSNSSAGSTQSSTTPAGTGASGTIVLPNGSAGVAVVHIEDASGNLLSTPVLTNYSTSFPVTVVAEPPDFSQGLVGGGATAQTFNTATTAPALAETEQVYTSGNITSLTINADSTFSFVEINSLYGFDTLCFTGGLHQTTGGNGFNPGTQPSGAIVSSPNGAFGAEIGVNSNGMNLYGYTAVASPHSIDFDDIAFGIAPYSNSKVIGRGAMAFNPSTNTSLLVGSGTELVAYTNITANGFPYYSQAVAQVPSSATVSSIAYGPNGNYAIVATTAGFYVATVTPSNGTSSATLSLNATPADPTYKGSDGNTYAIDHAQSIAITQDGKYLVALTDQPSATEGTLIILPISTSGTVGSASATVSGLLATAGVDSVFAY